MTAETELRPYTVTESNLKRGLFKDCADGHHHDRCNGSITHRFARPESGIWNYQCTCECHPSAFGDMADA
jgi:hypothetical protein